MFALSRRTLGAATMCTLSFAGHSGAGNTDAQVYSPRCTRTAGREGHADSRQHRGVGELEHVRIPSRSLEYVLEDFPCQCTTLFKHCGRRLWAARQCLCHYRPASRQVGRPCGPSRLIGRRPARPKRGATIFSSVPSTSIERSTILGRTRQGGLGWNPTPHHGPLRCVAGNGSPEGLANCGGHALRHSCCCGNGARQGAPGPPTTMWNYVVTRPLVQQWESAPSSERCPARVLWNIFCYVDNT